LSLEPAEVRLEGIIKREEFTNTDDPGEKPGTYWILHLKKAVCIEKGDNDFLDENLTVSKIQLVLEESGYKKYRNVVDEPALTIGTLFAAHTAHHHTEILLSVNRLEKINR